jgi:hypothetical protein
VQDSNGEANLAITTSGFYSPINHGQSACIDVFYINDETYIQK